MALRLLPFRQYDEKDVVNGYYLNFGSHRDSLENPDVDGPCSNGVLVHVDGGNLNEDVISYVDNDSNDHTPAKSYGSPIGRNDYPYNPKSIRAVDNAAGENVLGITLNQTLKYDENGEPLQYRAQKRDELQAVLPLRPVPVATKGLFMFNSNAFYTGDSFSIGTSLMAANNATRAGKFQNWDTAFPTFLRGAKIGTILATGSRSSDDAYAGNYYLVKLDCT